jgi:formylglycine-generating enzyme required for sulfatase activity
MNQFTEKLANGVTLEMVSLPAGEFTIGSPDGDPDAQNHQKPQHQVQVNSFAIGKYPITQEQYQAVMGNNPSHFKNNPLNPVENVSWDDAQAFCQKLSEITGKNYRLPAEAEWEYACRAGTTSDYYGDYAWYKGNSQQTTHPVGQKKPNAWGLYDMRGNVWEWCQQVVIRGGSWGTDPLNFRSALRIDYIRRGSRRDHRYGNFGFRVVCDNQMFFYNAFNFPLLTSSVKEFAVKLENMLLVLEHHLAISEDGLYCRIFYHQPSSLFNAYPDVYDTQKVCEMLNNFNKHKNYLWSFLQDCKA